ncbi:Glycosyl-hydrolase 97 N-terminal [Streptomyces sp. cf386]|nr:Glycosyl-hydrolase 97 N-terminal [Streptomyces sp. cf386]
MAVPTRTAVAALCAGLTAALLTTAPARAEQHDQIWTVSEAPHAPRARISLDDATGTLSLSVSRDGRTVIEPSPVGVVTERADLSKGLRFLHRKDRTIDERYRTKSGKRLDRRVRMNETRLTFATAAGARLDLVVRASADGVAYRYVLPAGGGDVLGETSAFNLQPDAGAWLSTYRVDNEGQFTQYTAATAPTGEYSDQALFATDGGYTLLAESDLTGAYSGARLAHDQGTGTYRIKLADDRIRTDGALTTPWRAMVTGDLATVTRSTFTDDLAPSSKVADTSWIRPGTVLWTWLAGGRPAGQSLAAQKAYVDYAAERNWPYEAVDAGWYFKADAWDTTDPNWQTNSWLPELVEYGRAKGVGIIVWIHQRDLDTPEERAQWLPTLERWGVKGVKIDFMDSEAQPMLQWYDAVLAETAAHHLMIDFHGSTIPKGIQRTWPHVMTLEGVAGEEKRTNTAAHLATLPLNPQRHRLHGLHTRRLPARRPAPQHRRGRGRAHRRLRVGPADVRGHTRVVRRPPARPRLLRPGPRRLGRHPPARRTARTGSGARPPQRRPLVPGRGVRRGRAHGRGATGDRVRTMAGRDRPGRRRRARAGPAGAARRRHAGRRCPRQRRLRRDRLSVETGRHHLLSLNAPTSTMFTCMNITHVGVHRCAGHARLGQLLSPDDQLEGSA